MNFQCCCAEQNQSECSQYQKNRFDQNLANIRKKYRFQLRKKQKNTMKYSLKKKIKQITQPVYFKDAYCHPHLIQKIQQPIAIRQRYKPQQINQHCQVYSKYKIPATIVTTGTKIHSLQPKRQRAISFKYHNPPILRNQISVTKRVLVSNKLNNKFNSFSNVSICNKESYMSKFNNNSTFPSQIVPNSTPSYPYPQQSQTELISHQKVDNNDNDKNGKMSWQPDQGLFPFEDIKQNRSCVIDPEKKYEAGDKISEIVCRKAESIPDDSSDNYSQVLYDVKHTKQFKSAKNFELQTGLVKCENVEAEIDQKYVASMGQINLNKSENKDRSHTEI